MQTSINKAGLTTNILKMKVQLYGFTKENIETLNSSQNIALCHCGISLKCN